MLVSKMLLKKWNTSFLWKHSDRENRGAFHSTKTSSLNFGNFQQRMEQHFPNFFKKGTTLHGIPNIFGNFSPAFLEFSVEWFAIQQFPEFLETFPENFCSICRCYANFRKFWFNGKRPRSTCSDVLLLPDIFLPNDPKSRVSFTFKPYFPETFCKW